MIQQYISYVLSTPNNHICTNLADYLEGISHDVERVFLRTCKLTSRDLWRVVHQEIEDHPNACLIIDDIVQDKRYLKFIKLVKWQYIGEVHGLVRGIDIVNLVHSSGLSHEFWPIDYRIYCQNKMVKPNLSMPERDKLAGCQ